MKRETLSSERPFSSHKKELKIKTVTHRCSQHCPRRMHQKPCCSVVSLRAPQEEKRRGERERETHTYTHRASTVCTCMCVCVQTAVYQHRHLSSHASSKVRSGRYRLEKRAVHYPYFTEERTLCKLLRSSLRDDIMATVHDRSCARVCARVCMSAPARACIMCHVVVTLQRCICISGPRIIGKRYYQGR